MYINIKTGDVYQELPEGSKGMDLARATCAEDLLRELTLAQMKTLSTALNGPKFGDKISKVSVAPKLWSMLQVKEADLTKVQVPAHPQIFLTGTPTTGRYEYNGEDEDEEAPVSDEPESLAKVKRGLKQRSGPRPRSDGKRPRLRAFLVNDVNVDLSTLPPQASIIAQALLKQGSKRMAHDETVDFLKDLKLQTKQDPWRIFRYYHRNLELLGVITPVRESE